MMSKAKQISVWVDNSPGQIARVAHALAKARISITAFVSYGDGNEIPVRLLVNTPARARNVLRDLDLRVSEEEVLRLTLPDKPGTLAKIAERLANAHININYSYTTVTKGTKQSDLVLAVSDVAGAAKVLKGL
ncbi:MAG: ACT domain-containing protein [Acidobacteria bacterium]|nr:MAG: ACT domain-containing protein [Acidobacteriota bacterium]